MSAPTDKPTKLDSKEQKMTIDQLLKKWKIRPHGQLPLEFPSA